MRGILLSIVFGAWFGCRPTLLDTRFPADEPTPFDSHVHAMSPALVADWQAMGIPFSRPDHFYTDIDTIVRYNHSRNLYLIAMSYVYANRDYHPGSDGRERMAGENDFILAQAGKYSDRILPFVAVDPLQPYAVEEIERCVKRADIKCGLKLHGNASQIYLTEVAHRVNVIKVLQRAAHHKMPVLLHFDNGHPKFGREDVRLLIDSILPEVDSLYLQIAHFGTSGGFTEKTREVVDALVSMREQRRIADRQTVVLDISAVALDKDGEGADALSDADFSLLQDYIRKIGFEHIVFGTDYPLYRSYEYREVLREKVGLSEEEMDALMVDRLNTHFKE